MNRLLSSVFLGATLAFGASMTVERCAGFAAPRVVVDQEQRRKKCTAIIAHAGVVIAIRRTGASTVVTSTATVNPASLFAWESATVAIIATGTTAAAPIGAEHLKSGTAPALRSRQSSAHSRGLLTQINEPRLVAFGDDQHRPLRLWIGHPLSDG